MNVKDTFYVVETRTIGGSTMRYVLNDYDATKDFLIGLVGKEVKIYINFIKKIDLVTTRIYELEYQFHGLELQLKLVE